MSPEIYILCKDCYNIYPIRFGKQQCPDCKNVRLIQLSGYAYEIGDHVIIRSEKEMNIPMPGDAKFLHYDETDPGYDDLMEDYAGQITFVTKVYRKGCWIELDIDKGDWIWSPFWVKPIEHKTIVKLKSCLKDDLFEL